MAIDYEQWCNLNHNINPLVRAMKSSMPEQYIGFYLEKALINKEIEYQKQFDWLERSSLDIYIPFLKLAIEYDGSFYHSDQRSYDTWKTSICRSHGIYVIRILELTKTHVKSKKHNEINYFYKKNYINIDLAITDLIKKINKKYNLSLRVDINIERDKEEIISYVQNKYYKKSIAYIWPEVKDYWLDETNDKTIFDVLYSSDGCYSLKCPKCNHRFNLYMHYCHGRLSLIPCLCESTEVENDFITAILRYKESGDVIKFDNSLRSRRLHDRMLRVVKKMWHCKSREEAELYKKLGFDSPYIDVYLSIYG